MAQSRTAVDAARRTDFMEVSCSTSETSSRLKQFAFARFVPHAWLRGTLRPGAATPARRIASFSPEKPRQKTHDAEGDQHSGQQNEVSEQIKHLARGTVTSAHIALHGPLGE